MKIILIKFKEAKNVIPIINKVMFCKKLRQTQELPKFPYKIIRRFVAPIALKIPSLLRCNQLDHKIGAFIPKRWNSYALMEMKSCLLRNCVEMVEWDFKMKKIDLNICISFNAVMPIRDAHEWGEFRWKSDNFTLWPGIGHKGWARCGNRSFIMLNVWAIYRWFAYR